jgi:hypothetical protein
LSQQKIKIIQNLLKKQDKYDLAIKLENAHYEDVLVEQWNDNPIVQRVIYVHPNYFLELLNLDKESKDLLLRLFNAFKSNNNVIDLLEFKINSDINIENISDTLYIFVDEAGDMDFSAKGSIHYMFNFLIKRRPFNLHEYVSNYRYSLLERNLDPLNGKKLDLESFHAHNDNKFIKNELFNIISTFDQKSVKTYSYILEKPKVDPEKRKEKDRFYIDNLSCAIQKLLDKLKIDKNFILITDSLPIKKNIRKQEGALKKGIKEYLKSINSTIRYDIFHHCSASSANLQIIDYISWAIFRKYEHHDSSYFNRVKHYLIGLDVMTADREGVHYGK